MATRQYIGARYVPKFYENSLGTSEWQAGVIYEPLTIVTYNGNSYTSKRAVPANIGNPSANNYYWVATGNYSEQIQELANKISVIESYYVTPEMFGAVGDGITDDTIAVQNAINSGHAVLFTNVYLIDTVNVRKDVALIGCGGVIKPAFISDALSPNQTAFDISADFVTINGVSFEGTLYTEHNTNRQPVIDSENCKTLIIENCNFKNFGGEYINVTGTAIYDFYAVYIRAVDIDSVIIKNCVFEGNAGDEQIIVTPHTKSNKTYIVFENNTVKNCNNGSSINLFGSEVNANCNKFNTVTYAGSALNVCTELLNFSNNSFIGCSYGDIIDGSEHCAIHVEKAYINNNYVDGTITMFANIVGTYVEMKNNYVACGSALKHELTAYISNTVPVQLQNSVKRDGAIVIVKDNVFKLNNSGTDSVIRAGAVNAGNTGIYTADSYAQCESVTIENNNFVGIGGNVSSKTFFRPTILFKRIGFRNNTIKNPNTDFQTASGKFLIVLDSVGYNNAFQTKLIDAMGNCVTDFTLSGGVYLISQQRNESSPAVPIHIIDFFHNHNVEGNFIVGITSQYYDTLNS